MILQGSAGPEVRSELYEELKARKNMTFPPNSAVVINLIAFLQGKENTNNCEVLYFTDHLIKYLLD